MVNERIRELWAKCVIKHTKDPMNWQTVADEFAELIVRECMSQIEEVKQIKIGHANSDYTQGFDDGMFVSIRTIEEHFGVEE